ncbi:MAG: GGDEF domain-containing protein [Actinomycetes bacterium]|nr:GGDEF domain-containing protein [Actinomycetes bacterium]
MSFNRLYQRLKRSFIISQRSQLTREDVNALRDNQQRVALIISARWLIIVLFIVFSVIGSGVFLTEMPLAQLLNSMIVPLNALVLVVFYNFAFGVYNKRLANLAVLNMVQLVLDVLVVAVLVYYSGGVESWFWVVYLLILIAAALIAEARWKIWALALFMCAVLVLVEWTEYFRIVPYQQLIFSSGVAWNSWQFVTMRSLWQIFMILGTALLVTNGVNWLLNLVSLSRESQLTDVRTGLYSRAYFQRGLEIEGQRALRDGRPLHVILLDLDNFGAVNARHGIQQGDIILTHLASVLDAELIRFDDGEVSANIVARLSGEEFAVLLVEHTTGDDGEVSDSQAREVAENLRAAVAAADVGGITVTASVGLATLPVDTLDPAELLERADEAMVRAWDAGGNQVCVPTLRDIPVTFAPDFGTAGNEEK